MFKGQSREVSSKLACLAVIAWLLSSVVATAQSTGASSHPKTPWGDPDLQGYYTNKYEYGTPFERPAAFAGKRVEEVSAQELCRPDEEASAGSTRSCSVLRR